MAKDGESCILFLALLLPSCVTLGKSLNHCVPQFPHQ